jgi:hypothetical protein
MVSRLIEEQDVSLEQHCTSKGELHLPPSGQAADGLGLTLIGEADGGEGLDDLLLGCFDALVRNDELEDRGVFLAAIDIVLDVEGADFVGRGEALDLAVGEIR